MNRRTTGRRAKPGALRCSVCGIEVEERWEDYDIMKPGGNVFVLVHLCDDCWREYLSARREL